RSWWPALETIGAGPSPRPATPGARCPPGAAVACPSRQRRDGGAVNAGTVTMAVTVLGSALTAAAALPYILDIVRGRAQPRIASWSIWTVVQAIGTASAFSAGQLPTACYTLLCAAGCAAVVFLGWRYGSREFGRLDAVCVTLAAEGVALLAVATWVPGFIPVSWAVAVSVATDFLAYLP